jgi:hypothetical protein
MEIEVRTTKGKILSELCPVETEVLRQLKSDLESIFVSKNTAVSASKQIKDATGLVFSSGNWRQPFQFDTDVSDVFPVTNYQLDAALDTEKEKCGHRHRILVEHCFDNRQAIGTNLLKFQLASSIYENTLNSVALPILICADKPSLKSLGWDGSIGSSEEYENAIRGPYKSTLTVSPILLVIRN